MALFDIIVLLLIGGLGVRGLMRGFVKEVLSLCAVVAGIVAVYLLHAPITNWVTPFLGSEYAAALLAFVLVFGSVSLSMKLVASTISSQMRKVDMGLVDRVLGFGFGAVKGALIATVCFVGFTIVYDALFGELSPRPDWLRHTRSYPLINAGGEAMSNWVAQKSRDGGLMGILDEKAGSDGETAANKQEKP